MLWKHYVFRRGPDVHDMWDELFESRSVRVLYISGRGFDLRAQVTMGEFVKNIRGGRAVIGAAKLLLVGFGYQLSDELVALTDENSRELAKTFSSIGSTETLSIGLSAEGEDDISATNALRIGTEKILAQASGYTDIVVDISSMPRVVYLALITGLLNRLVPDKNKADALAAGGVNLQVIAAEDPALDGRIRSEDPSHDLTVIPGFTVGLHAETVQDWPFVWFPILGEGRVNQLEKVLAIVPEQAEICPVLPHPSRDPRRGDRLLVEYKGPLFDKRQTPISNILYAHEANPFEAYRQLFKAMKRYQNSMSMLGGCRLVVTPLGSKLITLGAGLACFEMRPESLDEKYAVAIPYSGPTRYVAAPSDIRSAKPEITAMLLTGTAYV